MANLNILFNTKLSKTEYNISETIDENISFIIGMSITELANYCDVSPSKITKYAKKLGFSGYKEFQYALIHSKERMHNKMSSLDYQKQKINEFFINFDETKFHQLMSEIEKSQKIYLYGRGPSLKVSEYFVPRLRIATNKNIISNYDEYLFDIDLNKDEDEKLMIILTISGKTKKVHDIISICKQKNIKTIVLSAYVNNILQKNADLYINLLPKKEQFDRRTIRGRTMFFIYLEILTQEFMHDIENDDTNYDNNKHS